jgi:hypothetical protein
MTEPQALMTIKFPGFESEFEIGTMNAIAFVIRPLGILQPFVMSVWSFTSHPRLCP